MKRSYSAILSLVLCLFILCSCSGNDTQTPGDTTLTPDATIDLSKMTTGAAASAVLIENNVITVKAAGVFAITGSAEDARIVVDTNKENNVTLLFSGAQLTSVSHAPIYVKSAKNVHITSQSGTENTVKNTNGYTSAASEADNINAVIFSKCDLIFDGEGTLDISAPEGTAISGKDDLKINSGNITVTAQKHAIDANDSIKINGGNISLTSGEDALHTKNNDDPTLGIFEMNGGEVKISAGDDAIRAVASLTVSGGSVNVEKCDEGFKAEQIFIAGGDISINAAADGLNAMTEAADPDSVVCKVHITDGRLSIVSNEDAIDSNGTITMDGGEVVIYGPEKVLYGSGALDCKKGAVINGGKYIALTCPGNSFTEESSQAFFAFNLTKRTDAADIVIKDSAGNVIFEGKAIIPFNSVHVSTPDIKVGDTYTVKIGTKEVQITQNELITKIKES